MVVGLLTVDLHLPESGSLKEKRMILLRLTERLRRDFNVSVAEVEHQDLWQRSALAVATVNTSGAGADATLARVLNVIDAYHAVQVIENHMEVR